MMNKVVGWVLEPLPLTQAGKVSSQTTEVEQSFFSLVHIKQCALSPLVLL